MTKKSETPVELNFRPDLPVTQNHLSEIFSCNKDKALNIVRELEKCGKARTNTVAAITLLLSLVAALATADFKEEVFAIKPEVWKAIFLVGAFGAIVWLLISGMSWFKCRSINAVSIVDKLATPPVDRDKN